MDSIQLKICGMKSNVGEVAALNPDYLGFIFYEGSPRNFEGDIPELPTSIKKVGVFVDEDPDNLLRTTKKYELDIIQLHGNESPDYCRMISSQGYEIWKVFSVSTEFDFDILKDYEEYVTHFLFDTKGLSPGGNGVQFDWSILNGYTSEIPIVLSGGINPKSIDAIRELAQTELPIAIIDVNSRFEIEPGLKNCKTLKEFRDELQC